MRLYINKTEAKLIILGLQELQAQHPTYKGNTKELINKIKTCCDTQKSGVGFKEDVHNAY